MSGEPTLDVVCPACNAQPGQPCTQPTDTGRRPVRQLHYSRMAPPAPDEEPAYWECDSCGDSRRRELGARTHENLHPGHTMRPVHA